MSLRDWLRRERWSAVRLAAVTGRHVCTVRRWCSGAQLPRPSECVALAEITGGRVTATDHVRVWLARRGEAA